jgi:hypothetical protein
VSHLTCWNTAMCATPAAATMPAESGVRKRSSSSATAQQFGSAQETCRLGSILNLAKQRRSEHQRPCLARDQFLLSKVVRTLDSQRAISALDRGCAKTLAQKSLVECFSSPGVHLLVHLTNIMPARAYTISCWENTRKLGHDSGLCVCLRNAMPTAIAHRRKKILRFFNP